MLVSDDKDFWEKEIVVGAWFDGIAYPFLADSGSCFKYAKPINRNQEKIDEIDKQIAELTKQKEELCNQ